MAEKKKVPCRVCGKLFEPCSTCQSRNDMFKWRNFACSKKCAEKYINDTIAYRESLKCKDGKISTSIETEEVCIGVSTKKSTATNGRKYKKSSTEIIETEIEKDKTE